MGATTSPDNLPYPGSNDVPDIPADMQALALAVQSALDGRDISIEATNDALDAKVLHGPVANVPLTLDPGQLYAAY